MEDNKCAAKLPKRILGDQIHHEEEMERIYKKIKDVKDKSESISYQILFIINRKNIGNNLGQPANNHKAANNCHIQNYRSSNCDCTTSDI